MSRAELIRALQAAHRDHYQRTTRASPREYAGLKRELGGLGYNLEVRVRFTRSAR